MVDVFEADLAVVLIAEGGVHPGAGELDSTAMRGEVVVREVR